ncbi:MAG: YbaB/EbfC family nucleoid-associated protein [Bacillota bacterium]
MMGMGGNFNKMMKQAQKLQQEMLKLQEEVAARTVEATAGGGVVKVVANGRQEIVAIEIKPEAVDPDDVEMLQDLILTAVNNALQQAREMMAKEMGKLTGGLNIPGLF